MAVRKTCTGLAGLVCSPGSNKIQQDTLYLSDWRTISKIWESLRIREAAAGSAAEKGGNGKERSEDDIFCVFAVRVSERFKPNTLLIILGNYLASY